MFQHRKHLREIKRLDGYFNCACGGGSTIGHSYDCPNKAEWDKSQRPVLVKVADFIKQKATSSKLSTPSLAKPESY